MKERIAEFWNYPDGMSYSDLVHVGEIDDDGWFRNTINKTETFHFSYTVSGEDELTSDLTIDGKSEDKFKYIIETPAQYSGDWIDISDRIIEEVS